MTFLSGTWALFGTLMHSRLSPEEELMERSPRGDIWWTLAIAIKAEASRWVLPRASQQQQPGIATPSSGFKLDLPLDSSRDWLCNLEPFP